MAFSIKPRLSGENSIIMAAAAAALVVGIYSAKLGPVADAHATPSNDGNMLASVKKAGWQATTTVAALALLAQDANIVIIGGLAIILEELNYRHAIMANPNNGQIQVTQASYLPAGSNEPVGSTTLGTYAGPVEALVG
jgi:hypothetical protein